LKFILFFISKFCMFLIIANLYINVLRKANNDDR